MKVILANAPIRRFYNRVYDIDGLLNLIEKLKKPLGKGFYKFAQKLIEKNTTYGIRAGSRWPTALPGESMSWCFPFIMGITASYLRENGIEVKMMDCVANQYYSYNGFIKQVKDFGPDIVILETSTPTLDIDTYLAKKISKFSKVALAGQHITDSTADSLADKYKFVDFWLKGEYIKSALTMVKTQKRGIYEIELVKNMNEMPFTARDFEGFNKYYDGHCPTPMPQLFMTGSKGCPFSCTYCLWPAVMYKNSCVLRSPENIIAEIKENLARHPYKSITFDDDTWNVGVERISKLCDMLKEIGLPWSMMGRLDCSPDWLFDKMVDCGCKAMRFGVETFNTDVLKRINKKLERIDIQATLEHLTSKYPNLDIQVCMMKNLPGQTDEMHKKDMEIIEKMGFLQNANHRWYQLSSCVPFPGTPLYNELVAKYGEEKMMHWELYDGTKDSVITTLKEI